MQQGHTMRIVRGQCFLSSCDLCLLLELLDPRKGIRIHHGQIATRFARTTPKPEVSWKDQHWSGSILTTLTGMMNSFGDVKTWNAWSWNAKARNCGAQRKFIRLKRLAIKGALFLNHFKCCLESIARPQVDNHYARIPGWQVFKMKAIGFVFCLFLVLRLETIVSPVKTHL